MKLYLFRPQTWEGAASDYVNNDNITPILPRNTSAPNVGQPFLPRVDMSKETPSMVNSRVNNPSPSSEETPEMPGLLSNGRFQHQQVFTIILSFTRFLLL